MSVINRIYNCMGLNDAEKDEAIEGLLRAWKNSKDARSFTPIKEYLTLRKPKHIRYDWCSIGGDGDGAYNLDGSTSLYNCHGDTYFDRDRQEWVFYTSGGDRAWYSDTPYALVTETSPTSRKGAGLNDDPFYACRWKEEQPVLQCRYEVKKTEPASGYIDDVMYTNGSLIDEVIDESYSQNYTQHILTFKTKVWDSKHTGKTEQAVVTANRATYCYSCLYAAGIAYRGAATKKDGPTDETLWLYDHDDCIFPPFYRWVTYNDQTGAVDKGESDYYLMKKLLDSDQLQANYKDIVEGMELYFVGRHSPFLDRYGVPLYFPFIDNWRIHKDVIDTTIPHFEEKWQGGQYRYYTYRYYYYDDVTINFLRNFLKTNMISPNTLKIPDPFFAGMGPFIDKVSD